jgi:hypothetical protein
MISKHKIMRFVWANSIRHLFICDEKYNTKFYPFRLLVSCTGTNPYGNPEVDPLKIQENFMDWSTISNVMLSKILLV